jgi:hypothetical protein
VMGFGNNGIHCNIASVLGHLSIQSYVTFNSTRPIETARKNSGKNVD